VDFLFAKEPEEGRCTVREYHAIDLQRQRGQKRDKKGTTQLRDMGIERPHQGDVMAIEIARAFYARHIVSSIPTQRRMAERRRGHK